MRETSVRCINDGSAMLRRRRGTGDSAEEILRDTKVTDER
jgi:hypothetical protein